MTANHYFVGFAFTKPRRVTSFRFKDGFVFVPDCGCHCFVTGTRTFHESVENWSKRTRSESAQLFPTRCFCFSFSGRSFSRFELFWKKRTVKRVKNSENTRAQHSRLAEKWVWVGSAGNSNFTTLMKYCNFKIWTLHEKWSSNSLFFQVPEVAKQSGRVAPWSWKPEEQLGYRKPRFSKFDISIIYSLFFISSPQSRTLEYEDGGRVSG